MSYTRFTHRTSLILTTVPTVPRGRPKGSKTMPQRGRRSTEALTEALRGMPGGDAIYQALRQAAMQTTANDEQFRGQLRDAIARGGG